MCDDEISQNWLVKRIEEIQVDDITLGLPRTNTTFILSHLYTTHRFIKKIITIL